MGRQPSKPAWVHPVVTLRQQITAMSAALALVLANPAKKSVHKLRTATRRVEAQLELLAVLAQSESSLRLPPRLEKKLHKNLAKLRREAGKVRDLDVQKELVKDIRAAPGAMDASAEAKKLKNFLTTERAHEAKTLTVMIQKRGFKLMPQLEELMDRLSPVESFGLSPAQLTTLTREWFEAHAAQAGDEEALHTTRKAAKLARYLAESAGGPATSGTARLARVFETLQESGGAWHDLLTVRKLAHKRLGKSAELKVQFAQREQVALEAFRQQLEERVPSSTPT